MIGTGDVASRWLAPALQHVNGAALWSVLSRDYNKAAAFAATHDAQAIVAAFNRLEEFLADPQLDAVIVASPDRTHCAYALAAAAAGKHVFVEKPLATSTEDARRTVQACRDAGKTLAVGYHLRWHAGHRLLRQQLADGKLGKIRHMRAQWTLKPPAEDWRAEPTLGRWWSLAAVGTHALDLTCWMLQPLCGKPVEVRSLLSNGIFQAVHDESAIVSLRFESGATAEVLSSVAFAAPRLVQIYGTAGNAYCQDTFGPRGAGSILVNQEVLDFTTACPYAAELADFVRAIQADRQPESDGENGVFNVELLEQIA
jgi:1,5-anhydro-D-fructose reductase (1,5-anhydro-D-mannitol-forming)